MNSNQLERFSFLWSQARLFIAALALFIGGVPPLVKFAPLPSGLSSSILTVSWIISGLASIYLLYRWMQKKTLFGRNNSADKAAFFVSVISGINLGLVVLLNRNIGMSISSNQMVFYIVGIIYIVSAFHLHKRWKINGQKLF